MMKKFLSWTSKKFLSIAIGLDPSLGNFLVENGKISQKSSILFLRHKKRKIIRALDPSNCHVVFQPIVKISEEKIIGYEAFTQVSIQSTKFSSINELLSYGESLGIQFIIEKILTLVAIASFKEFPDNEKYRLFLNTSAKSVLAQLYTQENQAEIFSRLKVGLEIGEQHTLTFEAIQQIKKALEVMDAIVVLDNFGKGHSNYSALLLNMHPNMIKIPREFLAEIDKDIEKQYIFESLIYLASVFPVETIASGVETAEELKTVLRYNVDYVQGFFLAKPSLTLVDISIDSKQIINTHNKMREALNGEFNSSSASHHIFFKKKGEKR